MEHLLLKLARQLDSLDEASLTALWEKYANIVNRFEPSERWQEAVLVLSFIQAKRWKNQLFNTKWAARTRKGLAEKNTEPPPVWFSLEYEEDGDDDTPLRKATVLEFKPRSGVADNTDEKD